MPNKYMKKSIQSRGTWSQDDLSEAIKSVVNGNSSVSRASIEYNILRETLECRIETKNSQKGNMGPSSVFGRENEDRLSQHIILMQKRGFPLTRDDLRTIAYQFSRQLKINHKFNHESEKAVSDWLALFPSRHPDIYVRKSEGVSEKK
ncbi:hypothetical protein JTB14_000078 [Gonioctena quinquepunctata]|nr:hypothetical protein JTB14_000078 [Gonioctena quinquepunctata]